MKHIQLLVQFFSSYDLFYFYFFVDIYLRSELFLPFISLHTLSIDSTYLTNELLQSFIQQSIPLKR